MQKGIVAKVNVPTKTPRKMNLTTCYDYLTFKKVTVKEKQ